MRSMNATPRTAESGTVRGTTGMAAIEHHRDSQPLRDHVLKELGDFNRV